MYKVFVNESLLLFSDSQTETWGPGLLTAKPEDTEAIARNLLSGTESAADYHIPLADEAAMAYLNTHFEPVTAAGGIVLDKDGKILWIFRGGKWDLPKGKADAGETIAETALREVKEECGVQHLEPGPYLGCCYHIYRFRKGDKPAFKTTHWFLMHTNDTVFTPQAEEEITEIRFFEKGSAEPLRNSFRSLQDFLAGHYS